MKLFSRKESTKKSKPEARTAREAAAQAQLDSLRGRARRRLVGALVLVVAAVILVPLIISTDPAVEQSEPIVLPGPIPPMPSGDDVRMAQADLPAADTQLPDNTEPAVPDSFFEEGVINEPVIVPEKPAVISQPEPKTVQPEAPAKTPKPSSGTDGSSGRTDDGAVAIALLEGRSPSEARSATPKAETGSFVLQIAAYTSRQDAQSRRDKLRAEGVSNAFVEEAAPAGKATWRLRVGPFPTREAAQAAQTRLRALGYENSFISTK